MKDEQREILGDYELVELIGDGAQGKVFKARRLKPSPGAPAFVAIKMLRLMGDDEEKVEKFYRQADILRRLSHPNIVSYVDTFTWNAREWDESHCLVMEYLEGETLQDRIRANPRGLPWAEVKDIFERCLEALIYARSESVVHRDIKPSNIFLDVEGGVKIIDFDIARQEQSGQVSTIGWKGTFDYMAPDFVVEQNFRGDEQSDVFSLGVCFYQALSGSLPFPPLGEGAQIGYLNRWQGPDSIEVTCEQGIFRALVNATRFARMSIAPRRENRFKTFSAQLEHLRAIRYRSLEHKHKDKYELTGGLGRGAFSEVFQARRVRDGRVLVIKELLTGVTSRDFIRGIKVLQKYPHPGIVKHVDFIVAAPGRGEKKFFLVMEALRGMPDMLLSERLRRAKTLPLREVLPLFCQYLSALGFLHEDPRPIVHADIRPSSLYAPLGRPERGKLLDLGVDRDAARKIQALGAPWVLDYMAPEFALDGGSRGTPRSDLYALGLCLYEALTGKPPFPRLPSEPDEAWKAFVDRSRNGAVVPLDADVLDQYPDLTEVLKRALAAATNERYSGAADMRRDLEAVVRKLKAQDTEQAARETAREDSEAWTSNSLEAVTMPPMVTLPTSGDSSAAAQQVDWSAVRRRDTRLRRCKHCFLTLVLLGAAAAGGWFLATWWQKEQASRAAAAEARHLREQEIADTSDAIALVLKRLPEAEPAAAYVEALAAARSRILRLAEERPAVAAQCRDAAERIMGLGRAVPALFDDALEKVTAEAKRDEAEILIRQWDQTAEFNELVGMTTEEHRLRSDKMTRALGSALLDREIAEIAGELPGDLRSTQQVTAVERSLARLKQALATRWPGIPEKEVDTRLGDLRKALEELLEARLQELNLAAEKLTADDKSVKPAMDRLRELETAAPHLSRMFEAHFDDLEKSLVGLEAAARKTQAEKKAARVAAERAAAEKAAAEKAAAEKAAAEKAAAEKAAAEKAAAEEIAAEKVATKPRLEPEAQPEQPPREAAPKQDAVIDEGEERLISALRRDLVYTPPAKTRVDAERAESLLKAARLVEKGLEVPDLAMSRQAAETFIARVADFWTEASGFEGKFGARIQEAVWDLVQRELSSQAGAMLRGGALMRTPGQKAQVRIKFLHVLVRIDQITGGPSTCGEGDPLHDTVMLFFESDVDRTALLDAWTDRDGMIEANLPWIASLLLRIRDPGTP